MHPILVYISNSVLMIVGVVATALGIFISNVFVILFGLLITGYSYKSVMERL